MALSQQAIGNKLQTIRHKSHIQITGKTPKTKIKLKKKFFWSCFSHQSSEKKKILTDKTSGLNSKHLSDILKKNRTFKKCFLWLFHNNLLAKREKISKRLDKGPNLNYWPNILNTM